MQSPITQQDTTNQAFQLAADFVAHTSRSVFLTGKAGTGKTTFLKYISQHTTKKTAIVAPTGVAAINAGGMTMHSLFQLPFGIYVPGYVARETNVQVTNRNTLFRNLKLSKPKRELLQELELLIVDEVSMVRCDMLDATDTILRTIRRSTKPFGGVQVLLIGDLFQLPPVAMNEEWSILNDHYESPFFFDAHVMKQFPPLCIELKKIYRQSEEEYIRLLNHVRNNEVTDSDLILLNSRYQSDADKLHDRITLTTHNYKADVINRDELKRLPGVSFQYEAQVVGDFSDKNYPADPVLTLREGARVMFIRNDSGEERQYYNGRLATVVSLSSEKIEVEFEDSRLRHELKRETWRNIRYRYNKETDQVDEEELGSFSQYPIRLAWAITIHKSQGLTFDKVIVDAIDSFAAGQVYVALSRCRSLDGLVLRSRLNGAQISTDERVLAHARKLESDTKLLQILDEAKRDFEQEQLVHIFNIEKVHTSLLEWLDELPGKKVPEPDAALGLAQQLVAKAVELTDVSKKFTRQLEELLTNANATGDFGPLHTRAEKAVAYFHDFLKKEILQGLQQHLQELRGKSKVKKYAAQVRELALVVSRKCERLRHATLAGQRYFVGEEKEEEAIAPVNTRREKGQSAWESLTLFQRLKSVEKVSSQRGLAKSTIEGHLAGYILTGEINIDDLVPPAKRKTIEKMLEMQKEGTLGEVKNKLGDQYSYGEIKAVANHLQKIKSTSE